jgi:predicted PurR-regulated permease PerM
MVKEMPVTVKRAIELIGLFVLGTIVVTGRTIIMPLLIAFFFSLVLLPVFRFFRKLKVPEAIAVFLPILLLTIAGVLIIRLFSSQVVALLDDFPQIQRTVTKHLDDPEYLDQQVIWVLPCGTSEIH